jgi:hypothetical protein
MLVVIVTKGGLEKINPQVPALGGYQMPVMLKLFVVFAFA